MIKNVQVNHDDCVVCLNCTQVAETVFGYDEKEGVINVLKDKYTPEEEEAIKEAASGCPAGAITFDEE
jgi:ferredoxin